MSSGGVRVRVVPLEYDRSTGCLVGLHGGAASFAYFGFRGGMDLVESTHVSRHWGATMVLGTWIAGTLLVWRQSPYLATARLEGGRLRLGGFSLPATSASVRVARADRGYSVAVASEGRGVFLEVESEREARRLLSLLGAPWPGRGDVEMATTHPGLAAARRVAGTIGLALAIAYGVAVAWFRLPDLWRLFGIGALAFGTLSTLLFFTAAFVKKPFRLGAKLQHDLGRAELDAHVRLHDRASIAAHDRDVPEPEARERVLAVDICEPTYRWLERIDALGRHADGYRGPLPSAEELSAIVADPAADLSVRFAAARLLLRYGKDEQEIRACVADEAFAARLRIANLEDPAEAARELDALPPLFEAEKARPI